MDACHEDNTHTKKFLPWNSFTVRKPLILVGTWTIYSVLKKVWNVSEEYNSFCHKMQKKKKIKNVFFVLCSRPIYVLLFGTWQLIF